MIASGHIANIKTRVQICLITAFLAFAGTEPVHATLIIDPTFDSSITSSANSLAIQGVINRAVGSYAAMFADPITVSILFRYSTTSPSGNPLPANNLASSSSTFYSIPLANFLIPLLLDTKTPNDVTALNNLILSPLTTRIDATSANGRAVGLNTPGLISGTFDGIVTLNAAQPFQFNRTGGISPGNFDALRSIEHEIDEVLGLRSILPDLTDFTGNTAIYPQDVFRYSAPGVRSLTPSSTATSYFSIDGGITAIVGFNQGPTGDYGDWLSPACMPLPPPLVQYAFSCPRQIADISATSPEGINLDVIGYDLVTTVSEPDSLVLMLPGIGVLAAGKWRGSARRKSAPAP